MGMLDQVRDQLEDHPPAPVTASERVFRLRQAVDKVDEATTRHEERRALVELAALAVMMAKKVG